MTAALLQSGRPVEAEVYVWQEVGRAKLQGSWDYENFRERHLKRYLLQCMRLHWLLAVLPFPSAHLKVPRMQAVAAQANQKQATLWRQILG